MRRRYWLSFDLGLKGDYDNLFEWLDKMEARECGEFMATFMTEKTKTQVRNELIRLVDERARLYLVAPDDGGSFIIGKRKRPIWAGYALGSETVKDEK